MDYLLKTSGVIAIFYLLYFLFLRKETFFKINRFFLLSGLLLALLVPIITIPVYVEYTPIDVSNFVIENNSVTSNEATVSQVDTSLNTMDYALIIYFVGVCAFLIRFGIQLFSLASIIIKNKKERHGKYIHVITCVHVSPFSFFNWMVYNPEQFSKLELEQIITHEKVHVNQLHSIDVLIVQVVSILLWFNPFMYLYTKSLKQNLEFLADNTALNSLNSKKAYQYILLKTSAANHQLALSNNFYNSFIKKRIVMLQKSKSKKINCLKYLLVLPALGWFLMSFNIEKVYVESESILSTPNDSITQFEIESSFTDEDLILFKNRLAEKGFDFNLKSKGRNYNNLISSIDFVITKNDAKGSYRKSGGMSEETLVIQYFNIKNKFIINTKTFIEAQKDLRNSEKNIQIIIDKNTDIKDIESKKKFLKDNYNVDLEFKILEKYENNKIKFFSIKLGKGEMTQGVTTSTDDPFVINYNPEKNKLLHHSLNENGDPIYGSTYLLEPKKAYVIKSHYNDKSLKTLSKALKENGIEVTFNDVKRNENDTITGISIQAKSKNGNKLSYQQNTGYPITPIAISYTEGGTLNSIGPSIFSRETSKRINQKKSNLEQSTDEQRKASNLKQDNPQKPAIRRQSSIIASSISFNDKKATRHSINHSISYSLNDKSNKNSSHSLNVLESKYQDEFVVSGVITSEDGTPLPGTNVIINRTKQGTASDFDGKYQIKVKKDDELVFSYIGFKTKVFKVKADNPILNITLIEKQKDDVTLKTSIDSTKTIITTYDSNPIYLVNGTQIGKEEFNELDKEQIKGITILKGDNTTAYFGDKVKDGLIIISKKENKDFDDEEVIIFIENENPGNIIIRDRGKNKPLIIVDGKERKGKLKNMNSDDIEKINVLKGEKAIKKYGSKGKNGVIEITTKNKK